MRVRPGPVAIVLALLAVFGALVGSAPAATAGESEALSPVAWIAAGWFTYGATDDDFEYARRLCVRERTALALRLRACASEELLASELPARRVYLSRYGLDRHEVSRAELERCIDGGRCDPPPFQTEHPELTQPLQPAIGLSWSGAKQLCAFRGGRLPSEAEWERAARGDSARHFPWGEYYNEALANHGLPSLSFDPTAGSPSADDGFAYLAPVAAFEASRSPHGLVQMAGNVWEWTADSFVGVRAQPLSVNPLVDLDNGLRSVRGGSFRAPAIALRVTHREGRAEGRGYVDVGVRCAYDALRSGSRASETP
jgi:formylglycine-generating enzyme required for sulfatase activity